MFGSQKYGFIHLNLQSLIHAILLYTWLTVSFLFTVVISLFHGAHPFCLLQCLSQAPWAPMGWTWQLQDPDAELQYAISKQQHLGVWLAFYLAYVVCQGGYRDFVNLAQNSSPQPTNYLIHKKMSLSIHPWLVVHGCPPWCSQVKVRRIPWEPPYVFNLSLNPLLTSLPRQELNIVPLVFFSTIFILPEPLPCHWAPRTLLLPFF